LTGSAVLAAYRPAGGAWQEALPVQSPQAGTRAPGVVIDPNGRAVAVWAATSGSGWRVRASTRGADGSWSKPTALSGPDANGSIAPQLALEGSNDVLAVWSRSTSNGSVIEAATMNAAKMMWSQAAPPFALKHDALAPSLAVNKRGDGVIVWTSSDQAGLSVMASCRQAGGAWTAPVAVSGTAAGGLTPRVALDARGQAVIVWTQLLGGNSRVHAAGGPAATCTWSAARVLSRAGGDALTPTVALDNNGDGAVAWARYNGQTFVVQSAGYDRSGPALNKLSIPATGTVGRRLTFAVAPKDVWTTVSAIRWSFGDGTTGSGRATRHVYTRPGRYTAGLTVTDAFRHVTSLRRFVSIAAG
jgi:hypothetical protein